MPAVPVTSDAEGAGSGVWRVRTNINPIDDTQTVTLSLTAETGTSRLGEPVTFIARCKSNTTEAYVVWGDFLGDDSGDVYSEWKRVTVRIGAGQPREERWGVSTDRNATFAPSWAGNFLKELLDENRLVLQTIPYGENPNTAIFEVSGLRSVLGELAETCNWSF
nr:type VI secretion system-associated protein TagO [Aliiroseovarius sediminis]